MNKNNTIIDSLRFSVISPEFISIVALSVSCWICDGYARNIISYFPWDAPNFIIGFFGIPVALVAAAYKFGTDLLAKNRRLLLEAGLYRRCKNRVVFSCLLTVLSLAGTIVGYILVRTNNPSLAVIAAAILSSGWVSSMLSVASLAIADFTIKEIEETS